MCCTCCGPKPCACWHCFSITLSILSLFLAGGTDIVTGGSIPTWRWVKTFRYLYASNILNIFTCSFALILIRPFGPTFLEVSNGCGKFMTWLLVNIGLTASIAFGIHMFILLERPITTKEVSEYTSYYHENYGYPPLTIQWLQIYTASKTFPGNIKLGCCGGSSFKDYLDDIRPCSTYKDPTRFYTLQFDGSPTCCKAKEEKLCATNLQLMDYEIEHEFTDSYVQYFHDHKFPKYYDYRRIPKNISSYMFNELQDWIFSNNTHTRIFDSSFPSFDCFSPVKSRLRELFFVKDTNGSQYMEILKLRELLRKEAGIYTVGCWKMLLLAFEDNILIRDAIEEDTGIQNFTSWFRTVIWIGKSLTLFKMIIHVCTIIVFNYYYCLLFCNAENQEDPLEICEETQSDKLWKVTADRRHYPSSGKF